MTAYLRSLILNLILLVGLLLGGCRGNTEQASVTSIPIAIDDKPDREPGITIKQMIQLENNDSAVFGRFYKLKMTEDRIYILDNFTQQALLLFDRQGHYLKRTARGKGPEECLGPVDFYFDREQKQISIFDVSSKKMLVFDPELNFLRSDKLEDGLFFRSFTKLQDNRWLVHCQNQLVKASDSPLYSYLIYSLDFGTVIKVLLPEADTEEYRKLSVVNPISMENGEIIFCRPFDQFIYTLGDSSEAVKKYYLDFGKYNLLQSDKEAPSKKIYEMMRNGQRVTVLGDLIYTNRYLAGSFVHKTRSQYFIYSKMDKKMICSTTLLQLPYGELKGMVDEDTFILIAHPADVLDFLGGNEVQQIQEGGNDVVMLFSLD